MGFSSSMGLGMGGLAAGGAALAPATGGLSLLAAPIAGTIGSVASGIAGALAPNPYSAGGALRPEFAQLGASLPDRMKAIMTPEQEALYRQRYQMMMRTPQQQTHDLLTTALQLRAAMANKYNPLETLSSFNKG